MAEVILPHQWEPRDYQLPLWQALESGVKRAMGIWHRRAGKDDVCLHWAAVSIFQRPATYWHMLPEYAQGRKAIWAAINPHTGKRRIDEAFPRELRANTNENEMFIRFKNGATWQVVGSDRYDSAVGSPPAGVTFSEWALANPAAYAYLAPILIENDGWALFITTSRGRNHAKSMLDMARNQPGWFAQVLTIEDTKAISREAVEQQRKEYHGIYGEEDGDALIEQEYFCSFDAAILGSYYGKLMAAVERDGRVCQVDYDPERPVHTAWDLGVGDDMSLWFFQVRPDGVDVIDHYSNHGYVVSHYIDVKKEKGYIYGDDWVPHDAKARDMTDLGDEQKLARQRITSMIAGGLKPKLVPLHKVQDGINAVRVTLPVCRFDKEKTKKGRESLVEYRKEYDEKKRVFKTTPLHNWASHDADSFRGLCMAWKNQIIPPAEKPKPPPVKTIGHHTMDELWKMQKPKKERV